VSYIVVTFPVSTVRHARRAKCAVFSCDGDAYEWRRSLSKNKDWRPLNSASVKYKDEDVSVLSCAFCSATSESAVRSSLM